LTTVAIFVVNFKIKKLLAFSDYSNLAIPQVLAKSVGNLAGNCCPHGHDVTNFDKIVKMKGMTTIYHNETLLSTKS
jgi:hypothetical protein